ncbi:MAG: hypothetical protein ACKVQB_06790 [Bacteroidia bacterium]
MIKLFKNSLIIILCLISGIGICDDFTYKPDVGDKFQYKISRHGKYFPATFIYDIQENASHFYWKWGNGEPVCGKWNEPENNNSNVLNDLKDTLLIKNTNLLYLNSEIFKQIKAGKNFKLNIQGRDLEFKCGPPMEYELPITGAALKCSVLTAITEDNKVMLHVLDNASFPLITSLIDDVSWELEKIFPMPMFPITHKIVGLKIDNKKADMFNRYIKETCVQLDIDFTEKYKKLEFNEFFCPTVGVRFSTKNDTIVSLQLLSSGSTLYGYRWQTYNGNVWGLFGLGDKRQAIESKFGKPIITKGGKCYYPDRGFYFIYNSEGDLVEVEYE